MCKKKSVAIIGCGEDEEAQKLDSSKFEFWGVNNGYLRNEGLPWSRWFEIHRITKEDGIHYRRDSEMMGSETIEAYLLNLAALDIPVYMQQKHKLIPKSKPYPLAEVLARFPRGNFNNTIAWEIALAIIEGFKEIHVYRICTPLNSFSEYLIHRQSTEYMLGIAEGLGIKVYVPHYSDLLKSKYLYGFQEHPGTYSQYMEELSTDNLTTVKMKEYLNMAHI